MRDVKRFDAQAIAGEDQPAGNSVQRAMANMPRRREKQCVSHSRKACRTVSVSEWDLKRWPSDSSSARNSRMIVDFAVEDDYGVAVCREDGLIAAFQVNNFQASGAERAYFGSEDALLVRAAMDEGRRGAPDAV